MYAYIRGTVAELGPDRAVIEAGGMGYELLCSGLTIRRLQAGAETRLYAHLHLAENVMALYGFYDEEERAMFRRLIGVTRVGPKLALAVLTHLTPSDVAAAIVTDNAAAFDRVPGLGKKTAQRVLLELKEHVRAEEMLSSLAPDAAGGDVRAEAVAALVSLGYDGLSASRAVTGVQEFTGVEGLITAALKALAK
ncbi:MAG: Holliday junction branch migration protein RuvA [Clostridia bacterium]|nr:Holliday junction branch migration protein RuvA [Clostridia bacterium]